MLHCTVHVEARLLRPRSLTSYRDCRSQIFDWTDQNDEQSPQMRVEPGETIWAEVYFKPATRSYGMNMTSSSGKVSSYEYALKEKQTKTESAAYFVLE